MAGVYGMRGGNDARRGGRDRFCEGEMTPAAAGVKICTQSIDFIIFSMQAKKSSKKNRHIFYFSP